MRLCRWQPRKSKPSLPSREIDPPRLSGCSSSPSRARIARTRCSASSHAFRRVAHHDEVVRVAHQRAQVAHLARPHACRGRAGRCSTAAERSRRPAASPRASPTHVPVFHHPRLEPLPQQLEHPSIRDAPRHELHQLRRGRCSRSSRGCRRRARGCRPACPVARMVSSACVALRCGRKPYEHGRKSASKIGSSTSFAAICTTRSRTVGIPSGRCLPSAFGMYRRSTGCGRYVPARSAAPSSSRKRSTPYCSTAASVSHRRPPRPCSASPASTPPAGRHSCRCGRTARGNGDPAAAWPRPTVGVGVVALCRAACARRGGWDRSCRPCPRAYLLRRHDHRRGPSLRPRCSSRRPRRYYDPLGLPLRSARFRLRLIRAALPRRRLRRRVSRVPPVSLHACCSPYPAETSPRVLRTRMRADVAFAVT